MQRVNQNSNFQAYAKRFEMKNRQEKQEKKNKPKPVARDTSWGPALLMTPSTFKRSVQNDDDDD